MGQTLSHGVYLPAEGERNCYSGLASNWNLLDAALGDIDGKASATHTHGNITNDGKVGTTANLPLITGTGGAVQAGSFGNQANTFCEGNDSRLSDARTPVAHMHTKSDVTDLLNSNFIPSVNNSYDLGSSSYQWNNVYSKGYYYNGVAWGLDQINVWTNRNILESWGFTIRENSIADSTAPSSDVGRALIEVWGGDFKYWGGYGYRWCANGNSELLISLSNWNGNTQGYWEYAIGVNKALNSLYFKPPNGLSDLGTSDNKWKTLNGVNPGALSLPNFDSDGYVDLSSDLTENVQYTYTPAVDGWLALYAQVNGFHAENAVGIFNGDTTLGNNSFRWANTATAAINLQRQTGKYFGSVFLPVRAGYPYLCWLRVNSSTTLGQKSLIFYKAKGNV